MGAGWPWKELGASRALSHPPRGDAHHPMQLSLTGPHECSPRGSHTWRLVLRGWDLKGTHHLSVPSG